MVKRKFEVKIEPVKLVLDLRLNLDQWSRFAVKAYLARYFHARALAHPVLMPQYHVVARHVDFDVWEMVHKAHVARCLIENDGAFAFGQYAQRDRRIVTLDKHVVQAVVDLVLFAA